MRDRLSGGSPLDLHKCTTNIKEMIWIIGGNHDLSGTKIKDFKCNKTPSKDEGQRQKEEKGGDCKWISDEGIVT